MLKDKEHLVALAGLFLAGLVVFLIVRALLIPSDFGVSGHYRFGALKDNRARPLLFAGHKTCETCHSEEAEVHQKGKHAGVSCEACHGASNAHAEDPDATKGVRPDAKGLCLGCHAVNAAKPLAFPQVDAKEHGDSGPCLTCHKPHRPEGEPGAKD